MHNDSESPAPPPVLGYQGPRSGKTVTVAWCADAGEAELLCGELHAAGVPAAAMNQHTVALGPYGGNSSVEVQVPVEDRDHAAGVLARLPDRSAVEPEPEPVDGSAEFTTDEQGARVPLAVVAAFATAQEMLETAAAMGSARIPTYLPNLVPRKQGAEALPPVFRVRVAREDLARARQVLEESPDPDEPRCPQCASWRVHRQGGGLLAWLGSWFGSGESARGVQAWQCVRCGHEFTWGNPRAHFEVVIDGPDRAAQQGAPQATPAGATSNCSSSVEPRMAAVETSPPAITRATSSK
jgi:hypothetical protein